MRDVDAATVLSRRENTRPQSEIIVPVQPARIALARGDGIGPEIMDAVLTVMDAAGAALDVDEVVLGEAAYRAGHKNGVDPDAWARLSAADALLKAPLTTPPGKGWKSVNVTLRKALGLYANVRPVRSYEPFLPARCDDVDLVVVRENEEDVYAGVEHQQTEDVVQCLKLITRRGCQRVIRYAFAYAEAYGRRKVTCLAKHNIMKLTDGLFVEVFEEEAAKHPKLEAEVLIVDIGAAKVAARPDLFDVIVCPNLYGDIVSDIAAEVTGSIGLAGSTNIGVGGAMFEAVHGSAPDIAGQDLANPSALLLAACKMLDHVGQGEPAARVRNAWLKTIEDGVHTRDVSGTAMNRRVVGTRDFARAVAANIGEEPAVLMAGRPRREAPPRVEIDPPAAPPAKAKTLVGVDVFVAARDADPEALGAMLSSAAEGPLALTLITNRGVTVWPDANPATSHSDHWRCRFMTTSGATTMADVLALQTALDAAGAQIIKTENLYAFDGVSGFSQAHAAA